MTELNKNIAFSCAVHMVLMASVLIVGSGVKNATRRILDPYMDIIIVESPTEKGSREKTIAAEKYNSNQPKSIHFLSSKKSSTYNPSLEKGSLSGSDSTLLSKDRDNDKMVAVTTEGSMHAEKTNSSADRSNSPIGFSVYSSSINNDYSLSKSDTSNQKGYISDNYKTIRALIEKSLIYPSLAKKRRMEGTVLVDFKINHNGIAEDVRVLKGSGYSILDSAARETIIKASPFPAANYSIEVPITFTLKDH